MMWKILKIKVITEDVFDYSHRIRKYMFPYCAFVCQVRSLVNVMVSALCKMIEKLRCLKYMK